MNKNDRLDALIDKAEQKCKNLEKEIEEQRKAFEKTLESKIEQAKILKKQETDLRQQRSKEFIKFLQDNKDVILKLFQHGRTSCDDDHITNGWGSADGGGCRCNKCGLIEILNGYDPCLNNEILDIDFSVEFYIH